jgi:hypothetical protein
VTAVLCLCMAVAAATNWYKFERTAATMNECGATRAVHGMKAGPGSHKYVFWCCAWADGCIKRQLQASRSGHVQSNASKLPTSFCKQLLPRYLWLHYEWPGIYAGWQEHQRAEARESRPQATWARHSSVIRGRQEVFVGFNNKQGKQSRAVSI